MDIQISIIIPAYNEEQNLPVCLRSLAEMDFPKQLYEIIVVDNGSTDRTREIASQYDASVLVAPTLNVSGLRNLGAKESQGNILAFVDADCTVARDWLTAAKRYFNASGVAAWGSPAVIPEQATWVQQTWYLVRQPRKWIEEVEWLESMNLFVRKNIFLSAGGFSKNLVTCEDVDLCYRLKKFGQIVSDSGIKVIHHGEAATVKQFFKKEIWRGMGNYQGLFSHDFSFKELPSLALPLYFAGLLPILLIAALITKESLLFFCLIVLWIFPSCLAIIKKGGRQVSPRSWLKLFSLLQIYFLARTAAIFKVKPTR